MKAAVPISAFSSAILLAALPVTVDTERGRAHMQRVPASVRTFLCGVVSNIAAAGMPQMCVRQEGEGELRGFLYEDLGGDGARQAEDSGLAGWRIAISGPVGTTTITDGDGSFDVPRLPGGAYKIAAIPPEEGWMQTTGDGMPLSVELAEGETRSGLSFGQFKRVTMSGEVWGDEDRNLLPGADEPRLEGWTVFADRADGTGSSGRIDEGEPITTTDVNGNYILTGLAPGRYEICEVQESGWKQTTPAAGQCYPLIPESRVHGFGSDFGNVQTR